MVKRGASSLAEKIVKTDETENRLSPTTRFHQNQKMGGVDLNDQSVNTNRIRIREKKWW